MSSQLRQHLRQFCKFIVAVICLPRWAGKHDNSTLGRTGSPDNRKLRRQIKHLLRLLRRDGPVSQDAHCQCFKSSLFRGLILWKSAHGREAIAKRSFAHPHRWVGARVPGSKRGKGLAQSLLAIPFAELLLPVPRFARQREAVADGVHFKSVPMRSLYRKNSIFLNPLPVIRYSVQVWPPISQRVQRYARPRPSSRLK